jgi:hypothetical protein
MNSDAPILRWGQRLRHGFVDGFVPQPIHRWEWFFMRLLLAVLVVSSLQTTKPFLLESQPVPVGLARVVDLTFLSDPGPVDLSGLKVVSLPFGVRVKLNGPGWYSTVTVLALGLGILYVVGRGLWLVLPMFTLVHTMPWTLSNSQGFDHHGFQLVSMVLVFQTGVTWWWQIKRWRGRPMPALPMRSFLAYYSTGMVAFSYTVSAVTKLINTKGLWLLQSHHFCADIIKGHRQAQYDDPTGGPITDPEIAIWLAQHPWLTRAMFGGGFFLELFAFLALHSRPWSLLVGLAIISFHRSVWWLMRLEFQMHELLIWIFLVNVPFWLWWTLTGQWRKKGSAV